MLQLSKFPLISWGIWNDLIPMAMVILSTNWCALIIPLWWELVGLSSLAIPKSHTPAKESDSHSQNTQKKRVWKGKSKRTLWDWQMQKVYILYAIKSFDSQDIYCLYPYIYKNPYITSGNHQHAFGKILFNLLMKL